MTYDESTIDESRFFPFCSSDPTGPGIEYHNWHGQVRFDLRHPFERGSYRLGKPTREEFRRAGILSLINSLVAWAGLKGVDSIPKRSDRTYKCGAMMHMLIARYDKTGEWY